VKPFYIYGFFLFMFLLLFYTVVIVSARFVQFYIWIGMFAGVLLLIPAEDVCSMMNNLRMNVGLV
jgi:hypothetical protein